MKDRRCVACGHPDDDPGNPHQEVRPHEGATVPVCVDCLDEDRWPAGLAPSVLVYFGFVPMAALPSSGTWDRRYAEVEIAREHGRQIDERRTGVTFDTWEQAQEEIGAKNTAVAAVRGSFETTR